MSLLPRRATRHHVDVPALTLIALVHLAAFTAFWTFSWTGLILCLVFYFITGAIGVTLCYHRYLTHGSFKCARPVRYLLTTCGCLALQGGPITWVANHRLHHKDSDEEEDPHSPRTVNFLWAHMLWIFWHHPSLPDRAAERKYARDLSRDRGVLFLHNMFLPINLVLGLVLFLTGLAISGLGFGLSLVVWGLFLRAVLVWHSTWLVNSATHIWGYRNYETDDNSRNTWWVSLLTFGEGWHNNHHADQRSAAHGHRWFEIDLTYVMIKTLERIGLVWDVVPPKHKRETPASEAA